MIEYFQMRVFSLRKTSVLLSAPCKLTLEALTTMLHSTPASGADELKWWGAGAFLAAALTPGGLGSPSITGIRQAPRGAQNLQYAMYQQKAYQQVRG